jgi:hypothetical protein
MSTPCSRVLRPKAQVPTHKLPTHKLDLEDLLNNPRPPKRSKIADPTSPPRHVAPTVPKTPAPQDSSKSTGKRKSPLERASKYLQCLCFVYLLTLKQKKTLQSYRHRPPAKERGEDPDEDLLPSVQPEPLYEQPAQLLGRISRRKNFAVIECIRI